MVVHHVTTRDEVHLGINLETTVVRVAKPTELAIAMRGRKPIAIDDPQMARTFELFAQLGRIAIIGTLLMYAYAHTLAMRYKIDVGWSLKWQVKEVSGQITLTPKD